MIRRAGICGKEGYLDDDKLDAVGKHNARLVAIKYPKLYVVFRPLHDLRNTIKPTASKVLKKISPRYRQRLETIKILEKINDVQSELTASISEIENKMEDKNEKQS